MFSLTRMLFTERHRRPLREDRPGGKTPLVMRIDPPTELENFIVSNSKGELKLVGHSEEGVRTSFFELDFSDEDEYQLQVVEEIFTLSCTNDWGNAALVPEITLKDLQTILHFFKAQGLYYHQVFVSTQGYNALRNTRSLKVSNGNAEVKDDLTDEELRKIASENYAVGVLETRPVFWNEKLGPYVVFTAQPTYLGMLTRIDTMVSVYVHNPERGIVVLRLEETQEELEKEDDGPTSEEERVLSRPDHEVCPEGTTEQSQGSELLE